MIVITDHAITTPTKERLKNKSTAHQARSRAAKAVGGCTRYLTNPGICDRNVRVSEVRMIQYVRKATLYLKLSLSEHRKRFEESKVHCIHIRALDRAKSSAAKCAVLRNGKGRGVKPVRDRSFAYGKS